MSCSARFYEFIGSPLNIFFSNCSVWGSGFVDIC
jgi:hypothetical protein